MEPFSVDQSEFLKDVRERAKVWFYFWVDLMIILLNTSFWHVSI